MKYPGILLLGPTGTGKTPLGEYLQQNGLAGQSCRHFDFGQQLRLAVEDSGRIISLSALEIAFLKGVLKEGRLLEDHHFQIAAKILRHFLGQSTGADSWIVLNGLPRHAGQAEAVAELVEVRLVISLDCRAQDVLQRVLTNAGGDRTARTDDSLELVRTKLKIYRERTLPLVEYYRGLGVEIRTAAVGVSTTPAQIMQALDKLTVIR